MPVFKLFPGALAHGMGVVPGLHAQKRVRRDAEGPSRYAAPFPGAGRLAVDQIGEGRAAHAEDVGGGPGAAKRWSLGGSPRSIPHWLSVKP